MELSNTVLIRFGDPHDRAQEGSTPQALTARISQGSHYQVVRPLRLRTRGIGEQPDRGEVIGMQPSDNRTHLLGVGIEVLGPDIAGQCQFDVTAEIERRAGGGRGFAQPLANVEIGEARQSRSLRFVSNGEFRPPATETRPSCAFQWI